MLDRTLVEFGYPDGGYWRSRLHGDPVRAERAMNTSDA
jgi:hypothetical protein